MWPFKVSSLYFWRIECKKNCILHFINLYQNVSSKTISPHCARVVAVSNNVLGFSYVKSGGFSWTQSMSCSYLGRPQGSRNLLGLVFTMFWQNFGYLPLIYHLTLEDFLNLGKCPARVIKPFGAPLGRYWRCYAQQTWLMY